MKNASWLDNNEELFTNDHKIVNVTNKEELDTKNREAKEGKEESNSIKPSCELRTEDKNRPIDDEPITEKP